MTLDSWKSVYTRWRRWCALGLWQEMLNLLSRRANGCLRFIDGSHIKLHQFGSNPAGGQQAQAIGRTKGGLNTKLCALVEGDGQLMAAVIPVVGGDEHWMWVARKSCELGTSKMESPKAIP